MSYFLTLTPSRDFIFTRSRRRVILKFFESLDRESILLTINPSVESYDLTKFLPLAIYSRNLKDVRGAICIDVGRRRYADLIPQSSFDYDRTREIRGKGIEGKFGENDVCKGNFCGKSETLEVEKRSRIRLVASCVER